MCGFAKYYRFTSGTVIYGCRFSLHYHMKLSIFKIHRQSSDIVPFFRSFDNPCSFRLIRDSCRIHFYADFPVLVIALLFMIITSLFSWQVLAYAMRLYSAWSGISEPFASAGFLLCIWIMSRWNSSKSISSCPHG